MYKEYDIPRTEQIEKFQKMTQEERDALLKKVLKEDREQNKKRQAPCTDMIPLK